MEENYITLETAKLAKEKKCCISCMQYYDETSKDDKQLFWGNVTEDGYYHNSYYTAPSQSLLQKWLREKHEIHIISKPFYDSIEDKTTYVSDILTNKYPNRIIKSPRCKTYEEALEYALQEALNLL